MGVIVRQKVKGKGKPWWVFVSHNGKRTSKRVGDKKAVDRVASEIRATLKVDGFDIETQKPEIPIFKDYAPKWLAYIKTMRRASTHGRYKQVLEGHICL